MRTIVLIGSGPSLLDVDLEKLAGFETIAFNRSYLAWAEWPSAPTYFACLDPRAIEIVGEDLNSVVKRCTRSFLHSSAVALLSSDGDLRVTLCEVGMTFPPLVALSPLHDFGNVGATSLQIIAALGYKRVVLTGVDGKYTHAGGGDVSAGVVDPDHFRPDYRRGVPVGKQELTRFSSGWSRAAEFCRQHGVEVVNASAATALDCFPRATLDDALRAARGTA